MILSNRFFAVRVSEIKSALLFASTDETRFILNGVHFECRRKKAPVMVATDGRRLAVIESCAEQPENAVESPFSVTISTAFLKPLCEFSKKLSAEIIFEFRPQERLLASLNGSHCFIDCEKGAVVDGDYPNWRSVVPKGEKQRVPSIGVNAEFIGDFAKAAKLMTDSPPIISVNLIGKSEAMDVRIEAWPGFYGVLMPARINDNQEWQPEFVGLLPEPISTEETEAA